VKCASRSNSFRENLNLDWLPTLFTPQGVTLNFSNYSMKVLHILDSLNRGGVEILELDVCRNAAQNNLDLSFAATGGGNLEEDFKNSGVQFYRFQRRLPLDFSLIFKLRKLIKTQQISIVHTHQAVEGLHGFFACRGTNAKLVLSFHGFIADAKNRLALKFLIPRTAANVSVSGEFLTLLGEKENFDTAQNFQVIYNGIDEKRLIPTGKNFKAELGLPFETMLFGMIGNFYAAPRKDQLTVCRALPEFFRQIENAHFIFVGGNEENSDYEKCVEFCRENNIADRVHFPGVRKDVADILHSLDAFVLSTRHESFGIAAIEAMLVKVPTILSDLEPLLEISKNGEFAEIFQVQNAQDLTEKMINLAQSNELKIDLANRAFDHAKQNFSIEAHLENLVKLYESII
jgi:L-malate glycosyltransferase